MSVIGCKRVLLQDVLEAWHEITQLPMLDSFVGAAELCNSEHERVCAWLRAKTTLPS